MRNIIKAAAAAGVILLALTGCTSAADQANENLTKAAENFEVARRIVGINGVTDKVLWSVEGYCSYETPGNVVEIVCSPTRGGNPEQVERTTMGLSDNVTFVVTQMEGVKVSTFRPRVIFRPETIVPNFDLSTSARP